MTARLLRNATLALALLAPAVALAAPTEEKPATDKTAPSTDKTTDKAPAKAKDAKDAHHAKKTDKAKKDEPAPAPAK